MTRSLVVALVLACLACGAPAASATTGSCGCPRAAILPCGPLHPDGRWIKDATGRTIIVHGLEVARKTPPYHAPAGSFTQGDARHIEQWGFDAVRLGWFWKGLEPQPGQIDRSYVAELAREGDLLAHSCVMTLLELHQDGYNETIGGAGFPDWATLGGQPGAAPGLLDMPAWTPFENLYANTSGIANALAHAWAVMAAAFRRNQLMLGYDLVNEPQAGGSSPTCLQPGGCPAFDRGTLQPFENRLAAAVRSVDRATIAFYEPNIYFDVGSPSSLGPPPGASGPSGFAFHDYCLIDLLSPQPDQESRAPGHGACEGLDEHTFGNALHAAATMGVPPLFGEFGDTQDRTEIERMIQLADNQLTGWIYWSYKDWVDIPGGAGSGPLFDDSDDDGTLRQAKLAVLSEPYPMATAGVPLADRYDPANDTFTYTYAPNHRISAPTVIFTAPLHYRSGYTVTVSGGRVESAPDARYLELRPDRRAGLVRVVLRPAGGSSATTTAPGARRATACAASCASLFSPAFAFATLSRPAGLGEPATASGGCDANADRPAIVSSPVLESGARDLIARVQTSLGSGEVTSPDGVSVAYGDGDTDWLDLGRVPAGQSVKATVICRSGPATYEFTFAGAPRLPAAFSGSSIHDTNVSLASSRLAFHVPAAGRYVADVRVTGGAIELGLRKHDGSTPPAITFTTPGTENLGILRPGPASLDITALPRSHVHWTVSVHAL